MRELHDADLFKRNHPNWPHATLVDALIAQAESDGVRTGLAGLTDEQRATEVRRRIDAIVPVNWPAE